MSSQMLVFSNLVLDWLNTFYEVEELLHLTLYYFREKGCFREFYCLEVLQNKDKLHVMNQKKLAEHAVDAILPYKRLFQPLSLSLQLLFNFPTSFSTVSKGCSYK